ncbi:alkaline phosphatase D family protein [Demetria terragena]|uniref:alkaline phosphatase D family protein n=1 Tax=Demetria terragena TaxID=63959 RepID=UPI000476E5CB|nr:alkaline phosphatase D family protein [Demetria terragena]
MVQVNRRTVMSGAFVAASAGVWGPRAAATPHVVRRGRPSLPNGVMSGDVSTHTGTVWARSDRPARLFAQVGRGRDRHIIRGPWATPATDLTATIDLRRLRPGCDQDVQLWFETGDGLRGERQTVSFRTAPTHRASQSFVWSGDTCGQGWGINPDVGGMVGYRAMLNTRPDFFIHSGDTIYADGPLADKVVEPDGQIWRNILIPEVTKVAETLSEYRGRHRYNHLDDNLRTMYAQVPVLAQWDDHETVNNWYPGEILDDPQYTERRVDVLAARARKAWFEWQPLGDQDRRGQRTSDGRNRIYRKVSRGRNLDVFCVDMRTYKSTNTSNVEKHRVPVFGREQLSWLIRELRRSRATWKVIAADLPLGLVIPDGETAFEGLANGEPGAPLGREHEIAYLLRELKRHQVSNLLWVTADVHYCAAHHYDPARAAFTDFDPFWELVAGPISAGAFGPSELDSTFGPTAVFRKFGTTNQSPRKGDAHFFGHVDVADDGLLTASLRDITGAVLWRRDLQPV